MVITTAQLHSIEPELKFCAGSNPVHGVSESRDNDSSVNHTTKAINHYHHHYQSLTQIIEKLKQRILKKK